MMLKYGDYTLQEVAQLWDCSDELVERFASSGRHLKRRRQYWLFGQVLFEKQTVDEMAPDIRAMMKKSGSTRVDWEAHKREQHQLEQEIQRSKEAIIATEKRSQEARDQFFQQMHGMQETFLNRSKERSE